MALDYLPVDRHQLFLLPPDMQDWLAEGHLAWFVLDVVSRLDTTSLHARHPNVGVGRRAYDPDLLLALLIYAYCTGVRSSRHIERLCEVDIAYRVIAAGHAPDHTTIARFRQGHQEMAVSLFTDVLELCASAGLAKVGVVAIDGTKMGANASLKANHSRQSIEDEVRQMMAEAESIDAEEQRLFSDARGDELPPELADPRRRGYRLDAALKELEAARAARVAEQQAAQAAAKHRRAEAEVRGQRPNGRPVEAEAVAAAEAALAAQRARAADKARRWAQAEAAANAKRRPGRQPDPDGGVRVRQAEERLRRATARAQSQAARAGAGQAKTEQANTSDPQSRVMKTPQGWVQGYNAQAAVNEAGVVLAAEVTNECVDVGRCQPMMARLHDNLDVAGISEPVGTLLFDAGYLSEDNLAAEGPDRLIATGKAHTMRAQAPTTGPAPEDATATQAMAHRLRTETGKATYAKRQHIVEPVFGTTKETRGYRRFVRRGLEAVNAEWHLMMTAHNVLKLYRGAQAAT